MSEAMQQVPKEHPLMVAWNAYKASEDYENSFKWLAQEQHRGGSMWGAFMAGFNSIPIPATDAEVVEKLLLEAYVQIVRLEPYAPVAPENVLGIAKTRMQIALHCAGYTRSPKPDVNQMMMDAMMDALEPWANMKGTMSDFWDDNRSITSLSGFDWSKIKVGDLRRAASALQLAKDSRDE